jgi:hypothetical protein
VSAGVRIALIVLAAAAAVLPLPPALVETWYSDGIYPVLQRIVTRCSNAIPFALFDVVAISAVAAAAVVIVRCVRHAGWARGAAAAAVQLLTVAAIIYLAFLVTWGLNYRRVPLEEKLQFDAGRLTSEAIDTLAARNVAELNRLYLNAHAGAESPSRLATEFADAERMLRAPHHIVPSQPKPTILGGYFHHAAIAGMTDPFFLETLLAPDLFDVEVPFVVAHEWGHLAGYADESEANFVAWLACLRGDAKSQYSAWLALFPHVYAASGRKQELFQQLHSGPRIDLQMIAERYARTSRLVRFAARETYDRYLKANRVERGVESYDAVVQLILGTRFDSTGNPQLR